MALVVSQAETEARGKIMQNMARQLHVDRAPAARMSQNSGGSPWSQGNFTPQTNQNRLGSSPGLVVLAA